MYRRITVPLDGTTDSLEALGLAINIARKADCPVDLVTVALVRAFDNELHDIAVRDVEVHGIRQDAAEMLQRTAADVEARGVAVRTVMLEGAVPEVLADHLRSSAPDLVVMTTHDRGRLERLLIGSVAESVVRQVHVPVLLVHADAPAGSEARPIRHVLIAIDGSPFGDEVIPYAAALAKLMHAEITLLSVIQPLLAVAALATAPGLSGSIVPPLPSDLEHGDPNEFVSSVLEGRAQSLRSEGVTVHTTAISDGNPSRAIVDYAHAHDIDLIAMTTHGRGALKRLVAGSVSQAVLRGTHTPMLLFRPAM